MYTQAQTISGILIKFGQLLGVNLTENRLNIPPAFGSGYCAGYVFNEHIRLLISDYELEEDMMMKQPKEIAPKKILFFKFQHIFPKAAKKSSKLEDQAAKLAGRSSALAGQAPQMPTVLIATSSIGSGEAFQIHSNTETINIEVDTDYLNLLLPPADRSPALQALLQGDAPLFFEQLILPVMLRIVEEILSPPGNETFRLFFLRLKAEELICRLLMEIDKRQEKQMYPLHQKDIALIYQIRDQMIAQINIPPVIAELADQAAMSPTKLKRLFRQIFGDSIFSYYQQFRIKEAARLLKTEGHSVSSVGYQLGFTNLSHFSKLFELHMGMKPKQYSMTGGSV